MPPVDPVILRERAAALALRVDTPAALAAGVRGLLDDYADRTHRASPRLTTSGANNTYKTPPPVLRALAAALREPARQAGEGALAAADALWAGGSREERNLAAEVLGQAAPAYPEQALALVETWLGQIESNETADALARLGLGQLVLANPATYLEHARRWAVHHEKGARRLAAAVLTPLADDRHWDNVPGALSVVQLLMNEPDGDVRRTVAAALQRLARKRPGEIARFLRDQAARASSHSSWVIRNALTALEAPEQAEIIKALRG